MDDDDKEFEDRLAKALGCEVLVEYDVPEGDLLIWADREDGLYLRTSSINYAIPMPPPQKDFVGPILERFGPLRRHIEQLHLITSLANESLGRSAAESLMKMLEDTLGIHEGERLTLRKARDAVDFCHRALAAMIQTYADDCEKREQCSNCKKPEVFLELAGKNYCRACAKPAFVNYVTFEDDHQKHLWAHRAQVLAEKSQARLGSQRPMIREMADAIRKTDLGVGQSSPVPAPHAHSHCGCGGKPEDHVPRGPNCRLPL